MENCLGNAIELPSGVPASVGAEPKTGIDIGPVTVAAKQIAGDGQPSENAGKIAIEDVE